MTRRSTRVLAAAVGMAPAALVAQATTGTITGRVTDRASGAPVVGAQIQVVGTQRGSQSGDNGTFRITGVTAGPVQLRVLRIGFSATTVPVTVVAGQTTTPVAIPLTASAVNLETVTVTAAGTTQRAREQGTNVATISVQDQPLAATPNFSSLVQGRAAGVTVVQSSGTTGTGSRVRIRGANSLSQSNEPLLIIDGVRIDPSSASTSIGVGGQTPSRLNDLKPEDIETFDVLKGPAATGLYGTQAANGVIQITTRRGRSGRPQFNAYGDLGSVRNFKTYEPNYTAYGKAGPTNATYASGTILAPGYLNPAATALTASVYSGNYGCGLVNQALGRCVVDSVVSTQVLNTTGGASPFVDGNRNRIGGSVRGGGDVARYFLSTDGETEHGVFQTSRLTRRNYRANVDATPLKGLNVGVSAGYLSSTLQIPQGDNNILGLVSNFQLGGPLACSSARQCVARSQDGTPQPGVLIDTTSYGSYTGYQVNDLNQIQTYQVVDRFTTAFNGNYTPAGVSWLTFTATAGADVNGRDDQQVVPPVVLGNLGQSYLQGNRTRNKFTIGVYTLNASAVGRYQPFEALSANTTVGVQYQRDNFVGNYAYGQGLLAGTASLNGTSQQFTVGETNQFARTYGLLVQQQFAYRDRLFLTGYVRGDKNSAFGQNLGFATYPGVQLSYVPSEESFFPKGYVLSSLKLRGAFGQSGLRPGLFDALTYVNPVAATVNGQQGAAFTVGNFGLPDLRPERINEAEGGFDLGLLNNRVSLEATYFSKRSRDAIISVPLSPSAGGPINQLANIGRVKNAGLELSSTVNAVDVKNLQISSVFNFSTLQNKLISLRQGLSDVVFGLGGGTQRFSPGFPLGGYFQPKYTYTGSNTLGTKALPNVVLPNEIRLNGDQSAAGQYIGNILPRRTFTAQPQITVYQNFRLQALFDYRGGFYLYNGTEQFKCVTTAVCPANFLPGTSLAEQAASVAARNYATNAGYVQRADFTRLRELSLNIGLPQDLAQRYLRLRGASVNLAGRNLKLWTKYRGTDPEVNFAGAGSTGTSSFTSADFLTLPPVRYFIARFNLDF